MDKDTKKLLKEVERQGFIVGRTSKGHIVVRDRNGRRVATTGGTPSDWRERKNFLRDLRHGGFVWPHN